MAEPATPSFTTRVCLDAAAHAHSQRNAIAGLVRGIRERTIALLGRWLLERVRTSSVVPACGPLNQIHLMDGHPDHRIRTGRGSLIIPFVGIAGFILGILTATKPRRGSHGAAIIVLSVVLGIVGWIFWRAVFIHNSVSTVGQVLTFIWSRS